ncbi:MAG: 4Fe-4S dicluster domain-containing protein, partial [Rhodobacterales bacterium]|nr:4Fe-4S dicluster domain-containing protein [Rhodobacterales bacterium]
MTRWAMVADLRRCVGCQTCTAACKHTNATPPGVQWRRVLDVETGTFPNVTRTFVPVGCQHCADPPCMHVCPSTATGQRDDGIVTIDYDLCIGCAFCAVACPYQARYKVDKPLFAYGRGREMRSEAKREMPERIGVAQKCTFCSDRVDDGMENGLTPGVDPAATPACVNSCIANALHFGDLDNPDSNVSVMLKENKTFPMHVELGTHPGFHYLWDGGPDDGSDMEDAPPLQAVDGPPRPVVGGVEPWLQRHWDWRAAMNFTGGGTGTGLLIATALFAPLGAAAALVPGLAALACVGLGLFMVFLETGRPLRAPLNVLFHPQTSWMTREALVAMALFPVGLVAAWTGWAALLLPAGVLAAAFMYCQARILKQSKGIPAWRTPAIVPLILATGLTEGLGLFLVLATLLGTGGGLAPVVGALLAAAAFRTWAWWRYRKDLARGAPALTLVVLRKVDPVVLLVGLVAPVVAATVAGLA